MMTGVSYSAVAQKSSAANKGGNPRRRRVKNGGKVGTVKSVQSQSRDKKKIRRDPGHHGHCHSWRLLVPGHHWFKVEEVTPVIMATATHGDFQYLDTTGARFAMP